MNRFQNVQFSFFLKMIRKLVGKIILKKKKRKKESDTSCVGSFLSITLLKSTFQLMVEKLILNYFNFFLFKKKKSYIYQTLILTIQSIYFQIGNHLSHSSLKIDKDIFLILGLVVGPWAIVTRTHKFISPTIKRRTSS